MTDYSKEETAAYVKLEKAGFTGDQIDALLNLFDFKLKYEEISSKELRRND